MHGIRILVAPDSLEPNRGLSSFADKGVKKSIKKSGGPIWEGVETLSGRQVGGAPPLTTAKHSYDSKNIDCGLEALDLCACFSYRTRLPGVCCYGPYYISAGLGLFAHSGSLVVSYIARVVQVYLWSR